MMKFLKIFYPLVIVIIGVIFWIKPSLLVAQNRFAVSGDGGYIGEIIIVIFSISLVIFGINLLLKNIKYSGR